MASALYHATFVEKKGPRLKVELAIVHPDISVFGTDRLWAWKLVHEYVSTPDSGTDVELASKYVKSVSMSPVKHAVIAATEDDHVRVKRTAKTKHPTVVYTIEVTDAGIVAGIRKGDRDEIYDFVEPGKGKALAPPPKPDKAGKAGKAKRAAAAAAAAGSPASAAPVIPRKTYADLRDAALALLKKYPGSRWDWVLDNGMLQRWARDASVEQVAAWIECLDPRYQAQAAALIALDRAKDRAAAKQLLQLAEARHDPADPANDVASLIGLVPAWWRLGSPKKADAGYRRLADGLKRSGASKNRRGHLLFTAAARGGRWDRALELVRACLNEGAECEELLVPGVVAAVAADRTKVVTAILKKWAKVYSQFEPLSVELLRLFLGRDEPERYLELLLAYPQALGDGTPATYALSRTEAMNPKAAVALAEKLIPKDGLPPDLRVCSIAILRRLAPKQAEPWLKEEDDEGSWLSFLAAGGRDVRAAIGSASASMCRDIAGATTDRDLAIAALERAAAQEPDPDPYTLVQLLDLGRRATVDRLLERQLAAIAKRPAKQRDLPCRSLARAAAAAGRPDLGFAAIPLPAPPLRRYTARDLAAGAVDVGDFTTALAALEHVPDDGVNGRVNDALHVLQRADETFHAVPRAIPLRAIDDTYARGLIAAGARETLETVLAIAPKGALGDDVRVEIDAFLEGRPFAPR